MNLDSRVYSSLRDSEFDTPGQFTPSPFLQFFLKFKIKILTSFFLKSISKKIIKKLLLNRQVWIKNQLKNLVVISSFL